MEIFKETFLILFSVPVYAVLIGLEMILSYIHNKHYYSLKGTITNVYLSLLNMGLDILVRVGCLMFLNFFYEHRLTEIMNPYLYWFSLFIFQDFFYYVLHYFDHYCRLFWTAHVTHHSSDEFNLTVGFRSSVFQPLYRYFYFIPLSLFGFQSMDIMFMYAACQIYGILIHTQFVGKLGLLEYFLATPSHHKIHHASNVKYLDKNMGMVLIVWDKMFGTFAEEDEEEPIQYGLTKPLENPHHPVKIVTHEISSLVRDLKRDTTFLTKLKYIFYPPGWSHDGSTKTSKELQRELQQQEPPVYKEVTFEETSPNYLS